MAFTQRPGKGSQNQSNVNRPQNEPYINSSPSRAVTGPIHQQQQNDPYFQNQPYNPQNGPYNPYYDPRMQDPRMAPYGGGMPQNGYGMNPQMPYGQNPYGVNSPQQPPYGPQSPHYPAHQTKTTRPEDLKGLSFWRDEDENGYFDNPEEDVEKSSPLRFVLAISGLVVVSCMLWLGYRFATQSESEMIPLIPAEAGPYKRRPENPGGMAFPHQEMLVYGRLSPQQQNGQPVERVMPEQEQYFAPEGQQMQSVPQQPVQSSFEHVPNQQQIQQNTQQVPQQPQPYIQNTTQNPVQQNAESVQQQQVVAQQNTAVAQNQQQPVPAAHQPLPLAQQPTNAPQVQGHSQNQTLPAQSQSQKKIENNDSKGAKKTEDGKVLKQEDKKTEEVKDVKKDKPLKKDIVKAVLEPGYYMQLASLPTEASARKELARLNQKFKDLSPMIQPFETGVKKFHRVIVGPFSDRDGALKKCVTVGNGCKVIHIEHNNG
ncbi:MAG: hypothetical protein HEEMFOPI_00229 [Holosporales bacterium]